MQRQKVPKKENRLQKTSTAKPKKSKKAPIKPTTRSITTTRSKPAHTSHSASLTRPTLPPQFQQPSLTNTRLRLNRRFFSTSLAGQPDDQQPQDVQQPQQPSPPLEYDLNNNNIPLTAEELFYEMPPLAHDMFELEPREHRATLIWLPDCFENHSFHGKNFQMMMAKQLRVVVPNPPLRECTVLGGEEQRAWYDVLSVPFKPDQCDLDYTGMKVSMYQLHQLIRDEAIRIGQQVAPFNAPAHEIERLGTERVFVGGFGQGAALALFSGLRYPKRLAGIISHSGYIPFIEQTAEAAKVLDQNQRKQWELDVIEQQKVNIAEKLTKQTTQEHFQHQLTYSSYIGEKAFDISISAPNIRSPIYALNNHTDTVFPWLELAQPSFLRAVQAPLKCKLDLRMGKTKGHSISSLDLLEIQFWQNDIIYTKERNMPTSDMYQREKLRELGEFGDSVIVVDKYSPHADRVTMPWTSARILESANVAQQDVKRVEELLKLIPKHPERLEEIANEIDLLNKEADEELWKAYLVEAQQFVKHHEKYMTQRKQVAQNKGSSSSSTASSNNAAPTMNPQQQLELAAQGSHLGKTSMSTSGARTDSDYDNDDIELNDKYGDVINDRI